MPFFTFKSPGNRCSVPIPPRPSRLAGLGALFALDSFEGGMIGRALVSLWFFERFGVSEAWLGPLFFAGGAANAASHLAAAWLARRIGLIRTMVFTHIPSSLLLGATAFAPTFPAAVVLFLLRETLVEMDLPTRQSYLMAMVRPEERLRAAGVTALVRNVSWALAPALAGPLMQGLAVSVPLLAGAALKVLYDDLLYAAFRRVRPPKEDREEATSPPRGDPRPSSLAGAAGPGEGAPASGSSLRGRTGSAAAAGREPPVRLRGTDARLVRRLRNARLRPCAPHPAAIP
jgi:MFS family permease